MSDDRKILVAKRHQDRINIPNRTGNPKNPQEDSSFKKGVKRQFVSETPPKKNLANDRLKRLRTHLNEQVCSPNKPTVNTKPEKTQKSSNHVRKRHQQIWEDISNAKQSKKTADKITNEFQPKSTPQSNIFTCVSATSALDQLQTISSNPSDSESMEWSTTDEVVVQTSSSNVCDSNNAYPSTSSKLMPNKNNLYIVVDTNIFISELHIIRRIVDIKATAAEPVIFIPWIVIEELDFIKEDTNKTSLKWKAQEAIKYIESNLSRRNGRMKGQTLNDVNEQKDAGKGQDNKIIACCLQVLSKYENMVLLTNDINLKNKAHINNVPVSTQNDIMKRILAASSCTKTETILEKVTTLCATVIQQCAQNAYGQACTKMPICQNKPKSIQDCIKIFSKYWFAVFQEVLMKQFKKSVDDLSVFLTTNGNIKDDSNEMNELVTLCIRVCLFLKDVECCKSTIECTIRELSAMKNT